jgi:hypothetical protein
MPTGDEVKITFGNTPQKLVPHLRVQSSDPCFINYRINLIHFSSMSCPSMKKSFILIPLRYQWRLARCFHRISSISNNMSYLFLKLFYDAEVLWATLTLGFQLFCFFSKVFTELRYLEELHPLKPFGSC